MRTWIKICGTTSFEDALSSMEAGADALGFIFAPSKRHLSMEQAQRITSRLPREVERIGVFMDASPSEIAAAAGKADLTGIQLHGGGSFAEIHDYLPAAQRESIRKIRTVLVQPGFELHLRNEGGGPEMVDAWLLDSGAGSGKTFDWQAARKHLDGRQERFIIAGGLTPENVGEAIRTFRPWGVDVVTGVEREPGRKDPEKLRAFVAAVRKAEQI